MSLTSIKARAYLQSPGEWLLAHACFNCQMNGYACHVIPGRASCEQCINSLSLCCFAPPFCGRSPPPGISLPDTCFNCCSSNNMCVFDNDDATRCSHCQNSDWACYFIPYTNSNDHKRKHETTARLVDDSARSLNEAGGDTLTPGGKFALLTKELSMDPEWYANQGRDAVDGRETAEATPTLDRPDLPLPAAPSCIDVDSVEMRHVNLDDAVLSCSHPVLPKKLVESVRHIPVPNPSPCHNELDSHNIDLSTDAPDPTLDSTRSLTYIAKPDSVGSCSGRRRILMVSRPNDLDKCVVNSCTCCY